jgi:hypothetical protein
MERSNDDLGGQTCRDSVILVGKKAIMVTSRVAAIAQPANRILSASSGDDHDTAFTINHLAAVLTGITLLASFVSIVALSRDRAEQWRYGGIWFAKVQRSALFYVPHAIQFCSMTAAGLLAFAAQLRQRRQNELIHPFCFLVLVTAVVVLRGYSLADLASTKIAHFSGPSVALISMLAFVTVSQAGWKTVRPFLVSLTWILSLAILVGIATDPISNRSDAVSALGLSANALNLFSIWYLLSSKPRRRMSHYLRWIPLLISLLATLLCQTRLYLVITGAGLLMYVYRSQVSQGSFVRKTLVIIVGGFILAVGAATVLSETATGGLFGQAGLAFLGRLAEDTRTGQLTSFFQDLSLRDFVIGRGSMATWNWNGVVWEGATDVGYLSLVLFGGLPLLVAYVFVHVVPAVRALRNNASAETTAAALIVLLWAIRMFSSSYPSTVPEYFLVVLCLGRCTAAPRSLVMLRRRPMR